MRVPALACSILLLAACGDSSPPPPPPKWVHEMGGPVRYSPVIGADGTVYAAADNGRVDALDGATGAPRWSVQVKGTPVASPWVTAGGKVYVEAIEHPSSDWTAHVHAIDAATGKAIWTLADIGSIPTFAPGADGMVYLAFGDGTLLALDGATGETRWTAPDKATLPHHGSPGALAVGTDGTVFHWSVDLLLDKYTLNARDGRTGNPRWAALVPGPPSNPMAGSGSLFVLAADTIAALLGDGASARTSQLLLLDARTGTRRWLWSDPAPLANILRNPVAGADGTVYLVEVTSPSDNTLEVSLLALDGTSGRRRWAFPTGTAIIPPPAIAPDGTVYAAYDHLYALDGSTGTAKWVSEPEDAGQLPPALGADGTVYTGPYLDGHVTAFTGKTGARSWRFELPGGGAHTPLAVAPTGLVYLGNLSGLNAGEVYAIGP